MTLEGAVEDVNVFVAAEIQTREHELSLCVSKQVSAISIHYSTVRCWNILSHISYKTYNDSLLISRKMKENKDEMKKL